MIRRPLARADKPHHVHRDPEQIYDYLAGRVVFLYRAPGSGDDVILHVGISNLSE